MLSQGELAFVGWASGLSCDTTALNTLLPTHTFNTHKAFAVVRDKQKMGTKPGAVRAVTTETNRPVLRVEYKPIVTAGTRCGTTAGTKCGTTAGVKTSLTGGRGGSTGLNLL